MAKDSKSITAALALRVSGDNLKVDFRNIEGNEEDIVVLLLTLLTGQCYQACILRIEELASQKKISEECFTKISKILSNSIEALKENSEEIYGGPVQEKITNKMAIKPSRVFR